MPKAIAYSFLLLFVTFSLVTKSQTIINGYAKVTSVSGSVLTLSNVDETYDSFENGEEVLIYQVQDDVIGSNTTDASTFGDLSDIKSAGLFEVATIQSHLESSGTPTQIIISGSLQNVYATGSNSSLQIISFPTLGSPHYTTTSDMSALAWDGDIGGVLAFNVDSTLTISHDMDVDNLGFRGADANGGGSTSCS